MLNRNPLLLNCIRASLRGTSSQNDVRELLEKAFVPGLTPRSGHTSDVECDRLLNDARTSNTDSLLYYILKEANVDDLLPDRVMPELEMAYCSTFAHNILYYRELSDILSSFRRSGVQAIVLKGAALAEILYPDISVRPFADIDLLIKDQDLLKARSELLLALGYEENTDREFYQGYRKECEKHFVYSKNGHIPVYVELHTSLLPFICAQKLESDGLWDRAVAAHIGGTHGLVLSAEDMVLHLCLHIFNHNLSTRLLWLYDVALMISEYGASLNWKLMEERARTLGVHRIMGLVIDQVRQILDMSVPQGAASWSESCRLSSMERLLSVSGVGLAIWRYTLRLRLIKRVKDKLRLVFGQLFPSRDYIMRKRSISSISLLLFGYYHHLRSIFLKAARAAFTLTYRKLVKAIWMLDTRIQYPGD